jgi:tetratricopeptide (TPR) repeat protein
MARVMNFHLRGSAGDVARAARLADEALAAAPRNPLAHLAEGQVLRAQGWWREALREYQAELALNGNSIAALALIGQCRLVIGPLDEAISSTERALSLSPRGPLVGYWYSWIGAANLLQGRAERAVDWLERARDALPDSAHVHSLLAAA